MIPIRNAIRYFVESLGVGVSIELLWRCRCSISSSSASPIHSSLYYI